MTIADERLDSRYLDWLYSQVAPTRTRNPARSFSLLAEQWFRTEFFWHIRNDDNRCADGIDLREEFIAATSAERNLDFLSIGCSVLEMIVALCRRAAFESNRDVFWWFRCIIDNLGFGELVDDVYDDEARIFVGEVTEIMIKRDYAFDGAGGMFPLARPRMDQRKVEIRYQTAAYILENGLF